MNITSQSCDKLGEHESVKFPALLTMLTSSSGMTIIQAWDKATARRSKNDFPFPLCLLKKRALEETKINFLYKVILFAFRFCHSLMLIYGRLLIMTLGKAVLYVYKSLTLGNPRLRKHLLERKKKLTAVGL